VFQGRFGSVLVKTDAQLWTTVNYIARNPVDAGLCAQPGEWPWGSHHALVGGGQAPDWLDGDRLLEFYSSLGGDPHARYVAAVERR
jgi:putative transposase